MTVDDIVERGFALGGLDLGPRGAPLLFVFEEQEQQDDRFVAPRDFEGIFSMTMSALASDVTT